MDRRKHMHNSSSQGEQAFHKDCQRGKSLTGHMPRCCMIFYAPGGCTEAMGPTEILCETKSPPHIRSACGCCADAMMLCLTPRHYYFAGLALIAFVLRSAARSTRTLRNGRGTQTFAQRRTWYRTRRWLPFGKVPLQWCTTYVYYPRLMRLKSAEVGAFIRLVVTRRISCTVVLRASLMT